MWVSAFFGMATIYGEAVLAQSSHHGKRTCHGRPYLLHPRRVKGGSGAFLAGFFSVAIILALGFMGNMVQSNSIGAAFSNAFHIPALVVGFFVAAVSAFIFIGGVKRIASVTEKLVPVMAVLHCWLPDHPVHQPLYPAQLLPADFCASFSATRPWRAAWLV